MPHALQFHLDEHVSPAIAAGLRRRGLDPGRGAITIGRGTVRRIVLLRVRSAVEQKPGPGGHEPPPNELA
jgi:hypothetical protein